MDATDGIGKNEVLSEQQRQLLLGGADVAVVVAVSSTCRHCADSMPFYRALIRAARGGRSSVRTVFTATEPVDTIRRYLSENGVAPDRIVPTPDGLLVRGTPTLFVVRGSGVIVDGWLGRLAPRQEQVVMDSLH
jgi:hypothetical protein